MPAICVVSKAHGDPFGGRHAQPDHCQRLYLAFRSQQPSPWATAEPACHHHPWEQVPGQHNGSPMGRPIASNPVAPRFSAIISGPSCLTVHSTPDTAPLVIQPSAVDYHRTLSPHRAAGAVPVNAGVRPERGADSLTGAEKLAFP